MILENRSLKRRHRKPAHQPLTVPGVTLNRLRRVRTPNASRRRPRISRWRESSLRFRRLNLIAPAGLWSGGFWRGLWPTPNKRENSYSIKFVLLSLLVPFTSPCHNPDVAASWPVLQAAVFSG